MDVRACELCGQVESGLDRHQPADRASRGGGERVAGLRDGSGPLRRTE
jgi:hypothetical protein